MKCVMFTPVTARSAIGRMACLVVSALKENGHDVTVVRSEQPGVFQEPSHAFDSTVLKWNQHDKVRAAIEVSDFVLYHIGNHYEFHQGCLRWLIESPGIVCLHDYFLGNLFYGAYHSERETGQAIVCNWYGDEISQRYFTYKSDEFIGNTHTLAPMTEWLCSMATAVLTHSSWAIDRVLRSCPGPVMVTPLAYDTIQHVASGNAEGNTSDVFRVITIGHVNANKRVQSVIQAISASPQLRENTEYELVGYVADDVRQELIRYAAKHKVCLKVSGEVDDLQLVTAIRGADVISCLRLPVLEAGSASVIEAMLEGKPTLVSDAAHYSEIPDDCVIKIPPENEIVEITTALEQLLSNPRRGLDIGTRARAYAQSNHSATRYADAVVEIVEQSFIAYATLDAIRFHSNLAQRWGATPSMVKNPELLQPLRIFED